jgi:alpha-N-arabinofuranosidase
MRFKQLITVLIVLLFSAKLSAQSTKLNVQVDKPLAEIQPTMWGIFFEDINFGFR